MRKKTNLKRWVALCAFIMGMVYASAPSNAVAQNCSRVEKACEWLQGQQNDTTGLLRSYGSKEDHMAWTYDQAVGIIALLYCGDSDTAKRCADGMMKIARDPNQWVDGYHSDSGAEAAEAVAVGPNAWMGLALLKLYHVSGDDKYLSAAKDVANFILKLQAQEDCAAGSIAGGYDEYSQPFGWTSTEHNADAIALLIGLAEATNGNGQDYRGAAVKIAEWLDSQMWDPNLGCYYTGYSDNEQCTISDFPERLDSQTWTLLALQTLATCQDNDPNITRLIHNGLSWIDDYLCQVNKNDCHPVGFAKVTFDETTEDSFWAEGTAGYILAAASTDHSQTNQNLMRSSLRCLQDPNGSVPYSVGFYLPEINQQFDPNDIILAHFEKDPHCLNGKVGLYGDYHPDSGYYKPKTPGYNPDNVHTGLQSFRLVNSYPNNGWASLGLDLGPIKDFFVVPRDVSDYSEFSFWAKTVSPSANIKVIFRDADSPCCMPQAQYPPTPWILGNTWNKYVVKLSDIDKINGLSLDILEHVGFPFGLDVGNPPGTTIYVDDMAFTGSKIRTPLSNGDKLLVEYPQHWPYESVAATSWFVFVELETNPFMPSLPIEANVHIVPRVINRNNRLKRVMAIVRLPEGISKDDLIPESFKLYVGGLEGDPIGATWQRVIGWGNMTRVFVLFDKDEVMNAVEGVGRVDLTVVGRLESGQYIQGSDTVRIVQPRRRRPHWQAGRRRR